ncbi:MAG: T9SS type A sorting domain-containing protein [Candidatus Fermentibacteraceae bacterium]|nr:T9SS type A sorting domain-containing protein [Candidatus Fermentibacteraceae bacterium]
MKKIPVFLLLSIVSLLAAQEGSYSYYCYFHDDPIQSAYFTDGYYCGGPFRVNGSVILTSGTSGRNNDPYFYSFTLSSDYYIYGPSPSGPHVTVPQYDKLWIEPYEMMEQGSPWFNLGAEPLPFGADQIEWMVVRAAAMNYGLYLTTAEVPDGSRILLEDGQITVKTDEYSAPVVYSFSGLDEPVVWIENSSTDMFYLKCDPGSQGFSEELTIGTQGSIFFSGPLEYNGDDAGMLGLISVYGDGCIADKPYPDWDAPYDIQTDQSFLFSASILLLEGKFQAENYSQPYPQVDFTLFGGIQMRGEGYTSSSASGFSLFWEYDERLLNQSPPWYPQYELSGVKTSNTLTTGPELSVSSNPFSSSVLLNVSEPCTVTIYDSSGRLLNIFNTNGEILWDGSALPPGVYILHVSGAVGNGTSLRLVKL